MARYTMPPNGTELSRAAEGGVGWSELLGGDLWLRLSFFDKNWR